MNQDLVLGDGQHQQSGGVLGAQVQEQRGEASTAANTRHTAINPKQAPSGARLRVAVLHINDVFPP